MGFDLPSWELVELEARLGCEFWSRAPSRLSYDYGYRSKVESMRAYGLIEWWLPCEFHSAQLKDISGSSLLSAHAIIGDTIPH